MLALGSSRHASQNIVHPVRGPFVRVAPYSKLAQSLVSPALQVQRITLSEPLDIPETVSVQAQQLVGVFFSILSVPELPQNVRLSTVAKTELLRLLEDQEQQRASFQQRLQALLQSLLEGQDAHTQKLLASPRVPAANKHRLRQRLEQQRADTSAAILAWCHARASSPDLQQLAAPLRALLAAADAAAQACDRQQELSQQRQQQAAGRVLEGDAASALFATLPPGWRLYRNAALVSVDGAALQPQRGLKSEVDLLVVDGGGAVAGLWEVKLGGLNPMAAMLSDVGALTALQAALAGRLATFKYRGEPLVAPGAGGVAWPGLDAPPQGAAQPQNQASGSSASDSSVVDGSVSGGGSNGTAPAPWRVLSAHVQAGVTTTYILGRGLTPALEVKGLRVAIAAELLRLLGRSAADVAAAVVVPTPRLAAQPGLDAGGPTAPSPAPGATAVLLAGQVPGDGCGGSDRVTLRTQPYHHELRAAMTDRLDRLRSDCLAVSCRPQQQEQARGASRQPAACDGDSA